MSSSTGSNSKKRKAKQSQTQTPTQNPQPQDDQKCKETTIIVPYIPTPMVIEILSRLPIKTLFNCRLVCKNWATLTSTPEFAQLHLSRLPTSCLIKPRDETRQSKGLQVVDLGCPFNPSNKLVFVPNVNFPDVPIRLFNSCNGLLCFSQLVSRYSIIYYNIYVCNPILGEYITLPKPPHIKIFLHHPCAFGFSHETNQYKVVLSSNNPNSPYYHTDIYTLGERSWRSIGNSSYCIQNDNFYAFLNGALHWIRCSPEGSLICCFNFVSEQFHVVPEPVVVKQVYYHKRVSLSVINGNLSICDYSNYGQIVIWVMKEYGVKESWSKDIVITSTICYFGTYELIMINGNGKILMIVNKKSIILYDPESRAFESEQQIFAGVRSDFEAIAHVPSLISLKDIAKMIKSQGVGKELKPCLAAPSE